MRIKSFFIGLSAILLVSLAGCAGLAPPQWVSKPDVATVDNEQFTVHLKPVCGGYGGCESFILSIVNKTDKNIEVNWNKTLYISGGQTSGGFMFEGVVYKDRNNPKPPDVVFGNSTFNKVIWPNNLVNYVSGQYGGWRNDAMPQGFNGAYLSLTLDDKEFDERLRVSLSVLQNK